MFVRRGLARTSLALGILMILMVALLAGCGAKKNQPAPGTGQPAEDFLKGKTVTLIVPHGAGGGFDAYARLIAPYIEKYSGATLVIKNDKGAGGVIGRNNIWNAPKNGLSIGFSSIPSAILGQLAGSEGVKYDTPKYTYLARVATEPRVLSVSSKAKWNTIDDLKNAGRKLKFPSAGVGDDDFFVTSVLAKSFGLNIVQVTGYENNADTSLAVVKGDGDAHEASLSSTLPLFKSGDLKPVLFIWPERVKDYPNVPTALELAKDDQTKEFLNTITTILEVDRAFFGPPEMDQERTKEWRDIIAKALKDPELLSQAGQMKRPVSFMAGDEVQKKMEQVAKAGQKIAPILKAAEAETK